MFVSVAKTLYSFVLWEANWRFPSFSALEFRCCREIPLVSQKLTFYERISFITWHSYFSPRGHRAVSLQVVPFLRECKGRGYRRDRRAGQTERKKSEFIAIWFKLILNRDFNWAKLLEFTCRIAIWRSKEITDISIRNSYFVRIDFHTALRFATI